MGHSCQPQGQLKKMNIRGTWFGTPDAHENCAVVARGITVSPRNSRKQRELGTAQPKKEETMQPVSPSRTITSAAVEDTPTRSTDSLFDSAWVTRANIKNGSRTVPVTLVIFV